MKETRLALTRKVRLVPTPSSGQCDPSPEDVASTRALVEAGKLLDIELADHLIIGHAPRFVSLKERGVL